jgi:ATP phosphoribosyltransferase
MFDGVRDLLRAAGVDLTTGARGYRPTVSLPGVEAKLLKPQNIVGMLADGTRDVGFAGADWVFERFGSPAEAGLVELLDTGLDPVRIVAAAPEGVRLDQPGLRVASEYEQLTRAWIRRRGLDARFVRSYGATEVFPPEDADCIVDNTATGSTLEANGLIVVDELLQSSTRLFASARALDDAGRRERIEALAMVLRSVVDARARVMIEVNVGAADLEALATILPCMREPTVSQLHGGAGYAVKAAVPRRVLPELIPALRKRGGSDLVVTPISQIVV